MKKLLLLSALAFGAFAANAQDITVTVGGTPIVNNGQITSENYDPIMFQFGTLKLDPEVFLMSSTDADLQISVYNTSEAADSSIQFCWPSECKFSTKGSPAVQTGKVLAGANNNLAIDAVISPFDATAVYDYSCIVEIVVNGNEADPFTFTVNMLYDPESGVDGITADDAAPVYYDLNGRQVLNPEKGIYIKKQGNNVTKVIL